MSQVVNKIYSKSHQKMWCPHARGFAYTGQYEMGIAGAATNVNDKNVGYTQCQGLKCPALVLIRKESEEDWVGYCGETFGFLGKGVGE